MSMKTNSNDIKVGDKIFLRSNCSYNTCVDTGKEGVLLIPGKYSCEDDEQKAVFVCILPPFDKVVDVNMWDDKDFLPAIKETKKMIRVMSTVTKKCYEVDTEWCDVINDIKDYEARREFTLLDEMLWSALEDDLYYEDF